MSNGQGERELNPTAQEQEIYIPEILDLPPASIHFLFEDFDPNREIENVGPNNEWELEHFRDNETNTSIICLFPWKDTEKFIYKAILFNDEEIRRIMKINTQNLGVAYSGFFSFDMDNNRWVKLSLDQIPSDLQP